MHPLLALTLTLSGAAPATEASASPNDSFSPRDHYVLSARGPKAGTISSGVGGSLALVVPMLQIRGLAGGTGAFQVGLGVNTIYFFNLADLDLRLRLVDTEGFSLALFGTGNVIFGPPIGDDEDGMFYDNNDRSERLLGATSGGGGVIVSFGPEWLQLTAKASLQAGYDWSAHQRQTVVDGALGLEFPVSRSVNMFLEGRVLARVLEDGSTWGLPLISLGASF